MSALGAELRHILSEFLDSENFPWGIAALIIGAGVLNALIVSCPWVGKDCGMLLAGFSATLSTFSSLNYEVLKCSGAGAIFRRFYIFLCRRFRR